jgi:hypothetical protein
MAYGARGLTVAIVLFLSSTVHAQVPNELFEQARAVIAQYARDAAEVLPCAYMAGLGEPSGKITDQWGEPDVRRGLDQFTKNYGGASPAQIDTLSKTFAENFQPNFRVDDIRVFARSCWDRQIAIGMYTQEGIARPLSLRWPFAR